LSKNGASHLALVGARRLDDCDALQEQHACLVLLLEGVIGLCRILGGQVGTEDDLDHSLHFKPDLPVTLDHVGRRNHRLRIPRVL